MTIKMLKRQHNSMKKSTEGKSEEFKPQHHRILTDCRTNLTPRTAVRGSLNWINIWITMETWKSNHNLECSEDFWN